MEPAAARQEPPADPAPDADELARRVLQIVASLVAESAPAGRAPVVPTLDSQLERDLGIDSLAGVELGLRIEQALGVRLPDATLTEARTPRDLVAAVLRAAGIAHGSRATDVVALVAEREIATPEAATTLVEMLEWHAERHPDRTHITLLDGDDRATAWTYARLARGGAARRRGAAGGGHRARPVGRDHAADEPRVLRVVLRHPPRGRGPGADLPAGAARRSSAITCAGRPAS